MPGALQQPKNHYHFRNKRGLKAMSARDFMEKQQLESQIQALNMECSQRLNHLLNIKVMLEDDDTEAALNYLNELFPE